MSGLGTSGLWAVIFHIGLGGKIVMLCVKLSRLCLLFFFQEYLWYTTFSG